MPQDTKPTKDDKVKDEDIAFRNESIAAIRGLVQENKKLRDVISNSAKQRKSTVPQRRSSASNIRGLQTLQNTLGTPSKA